jgi:hypothetical protein
LAALLGVAIVLLETADRFLHGPKVVLGRTWPTEKLVSIDAIDHDQWDDLLHRYVNGSGDVDYAGWKSATADSRALDEYLAALSRADLTVESSRAGQLAFWINAYNAVTVRGILREYPTLSIQDHVTWLVGYNIWRDLLLQVGTRRYSLGEIEHSVLRKMREPRIHFAIVCASRGCPRLLNEAYESDRLEAQLLLNTEQFFADPTKFSSDAEERTFHVSPILKWYADDFGRNETERVRSLAAYLPDDTARQLARSGDVKIEHLDYDWRLNDQETHSSAAPLPPDESLSPPDEPP